MSFVLFLSIVITSCLAQVEIYPDYSNHPCNRVCNGRPMVCSYNLTIDIFFTMQPDCLRCTTGVESDCNTPQCIPGDGSTRLVKVINGRLPGPTIAVCQGDTIDAKVINLIAPETTTMHWHGMHQMATPWMDGVPMVTQCPIQASTYFRYYFRATEAGTHFYHSHSGSQRADGMYGHLIVRQRDADNPFKSGSMNLYDRDLNEHVISLLDWMTIPTEQALFRFLRAKVFYDNVISGILVNGFGPTPRNTVPPKKFVVRRGLRYRFRVIHAGNIVCPIEVSIDNHMLTVISSDGHDINPVTVPRLTITNGERFDFILNANQNVDMYAIRFNGSIICNTRSLAILAYEGARNRNITFSNTNRTGMNVNCVNVPYNRNCLQYDNLTALDRIPSAWTRVPDFKYFVGFDNYNYVKPRFDGVNAALELVAPFLNEISFQPPSSPLLSNPDASRKDWCNYENKRNCNGTFCECLHVLPIPSNSLVELIFVDLGGFLNLTHPMHLHGYSFRVIGQQQIDSSVTIETIRALDQAGRLTRNFRDPILKDTVSVPTGGYTIIRFIANNPGYWLLHCHVDFHSEEGMQMVVQIGGIYDRIEEIPRNFPTCGNFG